MELNKCIFIGKVKNTPQISTENGQKQALMKFTLKDRVPGASGQYVDTFMDIDVFAKDKKADLVEKYIVIGQELTIECKYINWVLPNDAEKTLRHAFQMLNVSFGFKPRTDGGQGGPPL